MSQPLLPTHIRQAVAEDATAIAAVHVHSWQWAYRGLIPNAYLDSLSVETRVEAHAQRIAQESEERTWVVEQPAGIVGFATSGPSRDPGALPETAEIGAIYLRQEVAGTGVGRMLLAHVSDDLCRRGYRQLTLWVLQSNIRARKFYEKNGWTSDGTEKTENRGASVVLRHVRYRRSLVPHTDDPVERVFDLLNT